MKFIIKRSKAAEAVKTCMSVVTGRHTLPVLSCLLVEAKDGEVRFTATDLDRRIEFRVPAEVKKPGSAALSARLLSSILSKSAGDDVAIDINEKLKTSVKCGDSSFSFPGLPTAEFPAADAMSGGAIVEMPSAEWAAMSGSVAWAASDNEMRYTMMGTHLTEEKGNLALVATNGASLSMAWLQDSSDDAEKYPGVIIPTETMRAIAAITEQAETIHLRIGTEAISVSCGGVTLTSKLIEGNYPQYRQVIPVRDRSRMTVVRVPVREFIEALDRASLVVDTKMPSVILNISEGKMVIAGDNKTSESTSSASLPVTIEGPPVQIALSAPKLQAPFRTWDQQEIEMEIEDGMSPLILRAPGRQFVLMPIRIQA